MRLIALSLLVLLTLGAAWFLVRSPFNYAFQDRDQVGASPTAQHWSGTDELGRDRSVRTAGALLLGFVGAFAAAALAATLAVGVGVTAAFAAPWISKTLMYFCDLALTLPWIFLLMIVRAALPLTLSPMNSALLTFFLLALLGAPVFVRVNYARALVVRRADWLLHSKAMGLGVLQVTRKHVLPHLRPLFLTQFLTYVPVCLIAETNLGPLGLGIRQPLPSWGSQLLELQNSVLLSGSRWVYLPMCLMVFVLFLLEMVMFEVEA